MFGMPVFCINAERPVPFTSEKPEQDGATTLKLMKALMQRTSELTIFQPNSTSFIVPNYYERYPSLVRAIFGVTVSLDGESSTVSSMVTEVQGQAAHILDESVIDSGKSLVYLDSGGEKHSYVGLIMAHLHSEQLLQFKSEFPGKVV